MTGEDKRKLKLIGWWFGIRVVVIAAAIGLAKAGLVLFSLAVRFA